MPCSGWMKPGRNMNAAAKQPKERVLGLAFHARPHGTSALGRIGARARDVHEGHGWVQAREEARHREGEVLRDAPVLGLAHPGGGDTEAEEAGVEASELARVPR